MKKLETRLANMRMLYSLLPQGDPQQNLQRRIEQARGCHSRNLNEDIEKCLERLYMRPGDFEYADPNGLFYSVKNVTDLHPWEIVHGTASFQSPICVGCFLDL